MSRDTRLQALPALPAEPKATIVMDKVDAHFVYGATSATRHFSAEQGDIDAVQRCDRILAALEAAGIKRLQVPRA